MEGVRGCWPGWSGGLKWTGRTRQAHATGDGSKKNDLKRREVGYLAVHVDRGGKWKHRDLRMMCFLPVQLEMLLFPACRALQYICEGSYSAKLLILRIYGPAARTVSLVSRASHVME